MTSKLAQGLSDKSWVREHILLTEDGKVCILVEYPGAEVQALVNHIHLQSITPGGTTEGANIPIFCSHCQHVINCKRGCNKLKECKDSFLICLLEGATFHDVGVHAEVDQIPLWW